jgi:hypothetical protein
MAQKVVASDESANSCEATHFFQRIAFKWLALESAKRPCINVHGSKSPGVNALTPLKSMLEAFGANSVGTTLRVHAIEDKLNHASNHLFA